MFNQDFARTTFGSFGKNQRQVKFKSAVGKAELKLSRHLSNDSNDNSISDSDDNIYSLSPKGPGKKSHFINSKYGLGGKKETNFGKTYQFARTLHEDDLSTKNSDKEKADKISPWRKMKQLGSARTFERIQTTATFRANKEGPKKAQIGKISSELFLKWKSELCKYTDLAPVTEKEAPMTITKPKCFSFKKLSTDKNSPSKKIPPAIGKPKKPKEFFEKRAVTSRALQRNNLDLARQLSSRLSKKRIKRQKLRTITKKSRKISQRVTKSRNCTRRIQNIATVNLLPRAPNLYHKFMGNPERLISDDIMERPLSVQSKRGKKHQMFRNIFIN